MTSVNLQAGGEIEIITYKHTFIQPDGPIGLGLLTFEVVLRALRRCFQELRI